MKKRILPLILGAVGLLFASRFAGAATSKISLNKSYTNTSGKPQTVTVTVGAGSRQIAAIMVNGVVVSRSYAATTEAGKDATISATVPTGGAWAVLSGNPSGAGLTDFAAVQDTSGLVIKGVRVA